jgi:hypothetical protein
MLLEPNELPSVECPYVGHLDFGGLAGARAVPVIGAEDNSTSRLPKVDLVELVSPAISSVTEVPGRVS